MYSLIHNSMHPRRFFLIITSFMCQYFTNSFKAISHLYRAMKNIISTDILMEEKDLKN